MKAHLRISVKGFSRNKNLKIHRRDVAHLQNQTAHPQKKPAGHAPAVFFVSRHDRPRPFKASQTSGRNVAKNYSVAMLFRRDAMRCRISVRSFRPRAGLPRFCRSTNRASAWRSAITCVTKLSNSLCTLVPVERATPSNALCRESSQRYGMVFILLFSDVVPASPRAARQILVRPGQNRAGYG